MATDLFLFLFLTDQSTYWLFLSKIFLLLFQVFLSVSLCVDSKYYSLAMEAKWRTTS